MSTLPAMMCAREGLLFFGEANMNMKARKYQAKAAMKTPVRNVSATITAGSQPEAPVRQRASF